MKIPLTDKFLWDLYKFLEPVGNFADIILTPRTPYKFAYRILGKQNPVFERYRRQINNQKFNKLIYWLKKNNYIKVKNLEGKKAIMITKTGLSKALKVRFKIEDIRLKKRKDGKWIMIIFDIPQKHNKIRNLLRSILQNLGYKIFQHSVWITSYDVSEKTERLLQFYALDSYVKIFLIDKL